jgi:hypothetical protein
LFLFLSRSVHGNTVHFTRIFLDPSRAVHGNTVHFTRIFVGPSRAVHGNTVHFTRIFLDPSRTVHGNTVHFIRIFLDPGLGCVAPMASYPVSLDAGINTELTGSSSSRGPRIPGFKASSLYPPEAKERALTWRRLFFPYFKGTVQRDGSSRN